MATYTPHEAPAKAIVDLPVMHPGRPIGRDDVLKVIYGHLRANKAVLIHGASGSGKTTLAAALASAYTQQSGGVLWLTTDSGALAEYLARVGRAYEDEAISASDNPLGMVGAVAALLSQHKPFIVIDGRPDAKATAQFISRCADNLPALILADSHLEGPWEAVEIGKLSDTDAAILLKQKAGITDNSADIDIYGIAKLLGYWPYALAIVARAMAASKQPPADYFKAVQQIANKVDADSTMIALTASYRALNTALQGLLLMMGASPNGEATPELLSMVSGVSIDAVDQAMNVLAQLFLIERFERYDEPYYRVHEKVLAFARGWLQSSNRLEGLQAKFRDAILSFASKYSATGTMSHPKLAGVMDIIMAVAKVAAEQGERDTANRLLVTLTQAGNFVKSSGYVYELLQLRQYGSGSTIAFPAYPAETFLDDVEESDEAFDLDDEELDIEDFEEEEALEDEAPHDEFEIGESALPTDTATLATINLDQLRSALATARQQKDILRQIQILRAIAKVQVGQGRDAEAMSTYGEMLSAYESIGDNEGLLEILEALSGLLSQTGNSQAAILHAARGAKLAAEVGDDAARLRLLMILGEARQELGESDEAVKAFSQALEIARNRLDKHQEALALYKLGYAYLDQGDPETAVETWEGALALFREQGKRDDEGRVLGGMGQAYSEMDRWSEAINFHTSALYIARETHNRSEEALQLSSLGQALVRANQLPQALLRYRQALHLAYESGHRPTIISAIVDLVTLMLRSNRLLDICQMLINDAARMDPNDTDVKRLQERITAEKAAADAKGVQQAPVTGTARDYAANAYHLLDS